MEDLPESVKIQLATHLYGNLQQTIDILQGKSKAFVAWMGPLLNPQVYWPME